MKATDYIRMSLESSRQWALGLITDMRDAPLVQPTPKGGNHPLWVLGHVVHSESMLLDGFLLGRSNRFPELDTMFSMTSERSAEASDYPSMDDLLEKFEQVRAAAVAHLDTLTDDDLDKPSHAPSEYRAMFGTVGACYAAMCSHVSFHAGQVADARRAVGRSPLVA